MTSAYHKGKYGEAMAKDYLQKKGMVLLHERYHSPFGEIDLIMLDGQTLVFVEVKARFTGQYEETACAITPAKQKKIWKTACYYVADLHSQWTARFDAVLISREGIRHIPNAFEPDAWA